MKKILLLSLICITQLTFIQANDLENAPGDQAELQRMIQAEKDRLAVLREYYRNKFLERMNQGNG